MRLVTPTRRNGARSRWPRSPSSPTTLSWAIALGGLRAVVFVGLVGGAGCGTTLDELLFQTLNAVGRTALDQLLTDLANGIAGSGLGEPSGDGGTGPGAGDGDSGDGNFGDQPGGPANGQAIFSDNACSGCHCADASGGCALDAPAIVGVSSAAIDGVLRGDASHPIRVDLTDDELDELADYLASLADGTAGPDG